jgi:gamma-glutamylcyclotransferase (GGCT)/AIG2-like uncharacterized protein YtfP
MTPTSGTGPLLFVYGLLRRGEALHHLMEDAKHLGEPEVPDLTLYSMGEYPAAVPGSGTVAGELYRLSREATLAVLDEVEGLGLDPPAYRREEIEVDGQTAWIYLYNGDISDRPVIPSGDWGDR